MTRPFFRVYDRVTVHGFMCSSNPKNKPVRGRVICVDRQSRYDETVVVLIESGETEKIETFLSNGKRWLKENSCHLSLGWPHEEK